MCLNTSLEVGKSRARLIDSWCLVCLTAWAVGMQPKAVAVWWGCALCVPSCCWGKMGLGPGVPCCEVVQCLLECQACGYVLHHGGACSYFLPLP